MSLSAGDSPSILKQLWLPQREYEGVCHWHTPRCFPFSAPLSCSPTLPALAAQRPCASAKSQVRVPDVAVNCRGSSLNSQPSTSLPAQLLVGLPAHRPERHSTRMSASHSPSPRLGRALGYISKHEVAGPPICGAAKPGGPRNAG